MSDVGYRLSCPTTCRKICSACRADFELFGYNPPVRAERNWTRVRRSVERRSPRLDWHGEDAQRLDELEEQGIVDLKESEEKAEDDVGPTQKARTTLAREKTSGRTPTRTPRV